MRPILWFLLSAVPVLAQPISAGLKVGVPFTGSLTAPENGVLQYNAPAQHYIIGPVVEVRLPFNLGIEFDALYRNLQYSAASVALNASGGNWEFPLLLKYRFKFPVARPFVDAGAAWDTITGLKETVSQVSTSPSELLKNTTAGRRHSCALPAHLTRAPLHPLELESDQHRPVYIQCAAFEPEPGRVPGGHHVLRIW